MKPNMKRFRPELPDFNESFSHSCNNLASYEMKKNSNPSKKGNSTREVDLEKTGSTIMNFVQKKTDFQEKKGFGTTLEGLKTFSRPNLD